MICKRSVAIGVVLLALLASPAAAQKGVWLLGVDAGLAMPQSDFGDFWDSGFLFAASAGYRLSPPFELGAAIGFSDHDPTDEEQAFLDTYGGTDQFSFVNYGLYGKYLFGAGAKLEPYLMGSLGLSSVKEEYTEPGVSEERTQTAFALGGAGGLDYFFSPNFGAGLRIGFLQAFTSEEDIEHDGVGSFQITGGIRFKVIPGE
jgi:opacity protein-like surface antigen